MTTVITIVSITLDRISSPKQHDHSTNTSIHGQFFIRNYILIKIGFFQERISSELTIYFLKHQLQNILYPSA